ncbi:4-(cytidine 5'-diphospho)-2-C-methyl-D-erythritol kinase [candidate division KSB1 bacterium]
MIIRSPAKINFGLWIGRKQDDGYHPISTIFLPVSLYDIVSIEKNRINEVKLICSDPSIPVDEGNICRKAADMFYRNTGIKEGITINLIKNIPAGGGLGGGSSNAAAVLEYLSSEHPDAVSGDELMKIARDIGADVPFFLMKRPCAAKGIGEILTPVDVSFLKGRFVVLVIPEFQVCTADAYAEFDRAGNIKIEPDFEAGINKFSSLKDAREIFINDFEEVIFPFYPQLKDIKTALYETGAAFASMTGSGSVMYGIYDSEIAAGNAQAGLSTGYRAVPAEIIT